MQAAGRILVHGTMGDVAYQIETSTEYRRAAVIADYRALLHRDPSAAELNRWVTSGLDLTKIRVQLEGSQEFSDNDR